MLNIKQSKLFGHPYGKFSQEQETIAVTFNNILGSDVESDIPDIGQTFPFRGKVWTILSKFAGDTIRVGDTDQRYIDYMIIAKITTEPQNLETESIP
jgi:hypothetical protein